MEDRKNDSANKGSSLIDFDPAQFLLNNETADQILDRFVQQKNSEGEVSVLRERTVSVGISFIVSVFCSVETFFFNIPNPAEDVLRFILYICRILAMGMVAFWLFSCVYKYLNKRNILSEVGHNIKNEMKAAAKEKINYTAILIVASEDSTGELKLFVDKRGKSDHAYFLPYCSMDKLNSIQYQAERIKVFMGSHYGLRMNDVVEVIDLSDEPTFSIKATRSGMAEEQHAFAFFRICLVPNAKKKFNDYIDGEWYSIGDLKNNPQAIERNGDIISKLDEHPEYIADSFKGERRPLLKIIWNITNDCWYKCDICATHDEKRAELSLENKLKALQSIMTIKDSIGTLDFAGGDPCKSGEALLIAQEAIYTLGESRVSITTTGDGIVALESSRRKALLKQCEITVDIEHASSTNAIKRAASGYVENNIDRLVTYGDDIQNLTINMPIIHTDLSDSEIEGIINEIKKVKDANRNSKICVSFLRLMPVGKTTVESFLWKAFHNKDNEKRYKMKSHLQKD